MKARSKELLDRAVAAKVAAIEIYNKPDFLYCEETFAVLAVNGRDLRISVPWLAERGGIVPRAWWWSRGRLGAWGRVTGARSGGWRSGGGLWYWWR